VVSDFTKALRWLGSRTRDSEGGFRGLTESKRDVPRRDCVIYQTFLCEKYYVDRNNESTNLWRVRSGVMGLDRFHGARRFTHVVRSVRTYHTIVWPLFLFCSPLNNYSHGLSVDRSRLVPLDLFIGEERRKGKRRSVEKTLN
jgi:hypothetical protein